ncbi:MAG: hypothetical protein ACW98W_19005 [Candidatus Hodarchaeales archaeon]|jgi:hypothetical protein
MSQTEASPETRNYFNRIIFHSNMRDRYFDTDFIEDVDLDLLTCFQDDIMKDLMMINKLIENRINEIKGD